MSRQEVPISELVAYKKNVLFDERRDSRIRSSVEATLDFFSQRRSLFIRNFNSNNSNSNSRPEIQSPIIEEKGGPYSPQIVEKGQYSPQYTEKPQYSPPRQYAPPQRRYSSPRMAYPQILRPMQQAAPHYQNNILGRELKLSEEDLEAHSVFSLDEEKELTAAANVTLKDRLKHFTFAWYACTMSTGGIAFTMSVVPNRFEALTALGTVIFVLNLFLFTIITIIMIARFIVHPGTLTHSLTNPHEGFFFATFWLTLATMLTNTTAYGIPNSGPWLITALRYAFWVYTACATLLAIFYYHVLFTVKKLVITNVLPGWVLPIFPAMLVGTLASAIAKTQPAKHAMSMLVAGLSYQGLGMMVAIMMYGLYFGRLLTSGLPADMSRPAMFIAVGPPSFTALALIGMAQDVTSTKIFSDYTQLLGLSPAGQALIPDILQLLALLSAIFLWVLAFWFFMIAVIASLEAAGRNDFHLNWYAYVFPNVGFTISVVKIGERLSSPIIGAIGTGMGVALTALWVLVVICHVRAVVGRKICWPGRDEDSH